MHNVVHILCFVFHSSCLLLVFVRILASGLTPPFACRSFSNKEFGSPILTLSLFCMFWGHHLLTCRSFFGNFFFFAYSSLSLVSQGAFFLSFTGYLW